MPTDTNITNDQITKLALEAALAGDLEQVRLCDRALGIAGATDQEIAEARRKCAEAIAEARARV